MAFECFGANKGARNFLDAFRRRWTWAVANINIGILSVGCHVSVLSQSRKSAAATSPRRGSNHKSRKSAAATSPRRGSNHKSGNRAGSWSRPPSREAVHMSRIVRCHVPLRKAARRGGTVLSTSHPPPNRRQAQQRSQKMLRRGGAVGCQGSILSRRVRNRVGQYSGRVKAAQANDSPRKSHVPPRKSHVNLAARRCKGGAAVVASRFHVFVARCVGGCGRRIVVDAASVHCAQQCERSRMQRAAHLESAHRRLADLAVVIVKSARPWGREFIRTSPVVQGPKPSQWRASQSQRVVTREDRSGAPAKATNAGDTAAPRLDAAPELGRSCGCAHYVCSFRRNLNIPIEPSLAGTVSIRSKYAHGPPGARAGLRAAAVLRVHAAWRETDSHLRSPATLLINSFLLQQDTANPTFVIGGYTRDTGMT
ncbi:hypothetical protein GGX14DRAFT_594293 [Mycena pura]|uniref:Uncharacterized protein n=1 Tax=Mycena pura TaxID=153505 RepID=A0AAD6UQZ5_9AGAR|nr:hypothetical protein GGX14DRAFT_594293 [Mycena pura]